MCNEAEAIRELIAQKNPNALDAAFGEEDAEKMWALRREFSESLRATGLTKLNQDVVVPLSRIVDLVEFAEQLQKRSGFPIQPRNMFRNCGAAYKFDGGADNWVTATVTIRACRTAA